ncbi:MAG: molybdopterin-dependent oxidoreductase [Actinomycetota bacterium]
MARLLAGGLSLSFLWAASRIEVAIPFPPVSLAERIVRLTPGDLATLFIDTLGQNAVRLLTVGSVVGFLVVFALLPLVPLQSGPRRPYLLGAGVALASAGTAFIAPVPPRPGWVVGASLGAGILYAATLSWLLRVARPGLERPDPERRRALGLVVGATAAFAAGGTVLGRMTRRLAGPDTDVFLRTADEITWTPSTPGFPDLPGLSPEVTAVRDHYVVDIDLLDPVVEADGWALAVRGLVDRPVDLSFAELQREFTLVEEPSVLVCISNPVGGDLVGSSRWTGVRLGEVLSRAGVREGAVDVVFRCADGYAASLPVSAAHDPGVLLAVGQNGRALEWEHGFPCRVRAPGFYGVKNPKWVEAIEVVDRAHRDYWTLRGWSEEAIVRTQSRIDVVTPAPTAGRPGWIAGVAWAGTRGVADVEVSVDGGTTWRRATLSPSVSTLAWTRWAYRWVPTRPGRHTVMSRAVDRAGGIQEEVDRPPHPSGASGYHTFAVDVA